MATPIGEGDRTKELVTVLPVASNPERPRYELQRLLGRGGIATVHEAYDTVVQRRVALKRIQRKDDPREYQRSMELFEREYHALAQLVHPRIVAVYDYAVDGEGPFYTMELLDGGDLQELVPLDWRKVCAIGRDVCAALSLLHSRRLVHRDVSARNVRHTGDGLAKLIDFGATIPVGSSKDGVVGTPPYTAPEVTQLMQLDARTDLYGLGATLYYALVGRHAYPARSFADLVDRWHEPPLPPSEVVPGIPAALDALVLDLLQLDPSARPASAAEVIERLAAIDGESAREQLALAQAYLSTPLLVGREASLERARTRLARVGQGRGSALLVEGASGAGRSRFLDACAIEAKLQGVTVLRADAGDSRGGDYGVVRALARSALAALPVAVEHARGELELLGLAAPELFEHAGAVAQSAPGAAQSRRAELQPALRRWFLAVSRHKPLLIAVDDLNRIDEPSLAWIALVSHGANEHPITIIATNESGSVAASIPAMKLFASSATELTLDDLSPSDTEKLLASVFGDVPNLGLVASRIHDLSRGNPRDTMRLAQHLLDRGLVRYDSGAWTLPARFDPADLPSSMAEALIDRVDALSPGARELACAISLCSLLSASFEECLALSDHRHAGHLMKSLDELTRAEIVRRVGAHFELAQQAWAPILQRGLGDELARKMHLRLAALFERRADEQFRWGQHLIFAGEAARGIEVLSLQSEVLENEARRDPEQFVKFVQSLPPDFETYDRAIGLCDELARPKREKYLLRSRVAAVVSVGGTTDRVHLPALISELCNESGLTDWAELDALDPASRLMTAIGKARERYAATPERERVWDPGSAIRQLARAVIQTSAVLTSALDIDAARNLPSLAPLAVLSPALGVIEWMRKGMIARMTGSTEQAQAAYAEVLKRTSEPDRAGLDESHHTHMRLGLMSGLGMIEAGMGLKSSLDWALELESEPFYRVNAVHVRMLYHLWQGDTREAVRCKHQVELLRIQNSGRQFFEGTHLIWQITAHAFAADLTRTRQTIDELEGLSRRYPGWVPVRSYGLAEYQRIRGDCASALVELESALAGTRAGAHQIWPYLAGAHLHTLHELGRDREALGLGRDYVAAAENAGLGYLRNYLLLPLALVKARLGHEDAAEAADAVIEAFEALGSTGLNLALSHETRARVALLLRDGTGFEKHAGLFKATFEAPRNPALAAKFEKLSREAQGSGTAAIAEPLLRLAAEDKLTTSRALSMLETCQGASERAECALSWFAQAGGVSEGYLFLLGGDGPICAAKLGEPEPPPAVLTTVESYLAAQLEDSNTMTRTGFVPEADSGSDADQAAHEYRSVLLSHRRGDRIAITGAVVLVLPKSGKFVYPSHLASEVSLRFEQLGDVTSVVISA